MTNRPKAWLAALLSVGFSPLGFLYVGQWIWAISSLVTFVIIAGCIFMFPQLTAQLVSIVFFVFSGICAWLAYRAAVRFDDDRVRPGYSKWYGLVVFVIATITVVIGVRSFVLEPFHMSASSMAPTLESGTKVIVKKWGFGNYATYGLRLFRTTPSSALNRGDIIIFEFPPDRNQSYLKRLVGLPGDEVSYFNKRLKINGVAVFTTDLPDFFEKQNMQSYKQFEEALGDTRYRVLNDAERPAFVPGPSQFAGREGCNYTVEGLTCKVPPGNYFMLGDNRDNSLDSRFWGFVPTDHIVGKVIYIVQ